MKIPVLPNGPFLVRAIPDRCVPPEAPGMGGGWGEIHPCDDRWFTDKRYHVGHVLSAGE